MLIQYFNKGKTNILSHTTGIYKQVFLIYENNAIIENIFPVFLDNIRKLTKKRRNMVVFNLK